MTCERCRRWTVGAGLWARWGAFRCIRALLRLARLPGRSAMAGDRNAMVRRGTNNRTATRKRTGQRFNIFTFFLSRDRDTNILSYQLLARMTGHDTLLCRIRCYVSHIQLGRPKNRAPGQRRSHGLSTLPQHFGMADPSREDVFLHFFHPPYPLSHGISAFMSGVSASHHHLGGRKRAFATDSRFSVLTTTLSGTILARITNSLPGGNRGQHQECKEINKSSRATTSSKPDGENSRTFRFQESPTRFF